VPGWMSDSQVGEAVLRVLDYDVSRLSLSP